LPRSYRRYFEPPTSWSPVSGGYKPSREQPLPVDPRPFGVQVKSVATMKSVLLKYLLGFLLLWTLCAGAQNVHQVTPVEPPSGSYVTFKFDWDQGRPWLQYSIAVDDAGNTHFEGVGNPIESGESDAFSQDFVMTDANRQKIFELAGKLDYFAGNFEAKQKNIAKTGQKTLAYHGRSAAGGQTIVHSSTYNYSLNSDVQELTRLFQAIAATLDYGRKLEFQSRFDKLGMDARLKALQDMQASHYIEELQSIGPILQKIADDPNMMHINRVTAKQLLKSMGPKQIVIQTSNQP
jgi:hypothetical protein